MRVKLMADDYNSDIMPDFHLRAHFTNNTLWEMTLTLLWLFKTEQIQFCFSIAKGKMIWETLKILFFCGGIWTRKFGSVTDQ